MGLTNYIESSGRFFVGVVLMFFAVTVGAQNVTVSAKLDTASMLIGDHVGLKLQFNGPASAKVIWPYIPDTLLGAIQVIGRGKIDSAFTTEAPKSLTLTQELNLTCYDSGFYAIPEIGFQYRIPPDTTLHTINATMLTLIVHTVKVDTTQAIKPIKGPMKIPLTFKEVLPWLLMGVAAALPISAAIWYWRKRRKKEPIFTLKPRVKLLPHEVALTEMEKLRIKKLWQAGRIKEYHSELTDILRRYIENRYQLPALEQTSAEIMERLSDMGGLKPETLHRLSVVLTLADMVKFAKALPGATENEKSLTEAVEFVYETTGTETIDNGQWTMNN